MVIKSDIQQLLPEDCKQFNALAKRPIGHSFPHQREQPHPIPFLPEYVRAKLRFKAGDGVVLLRLGP